MEKVSKIVPEDLQIEILLRMPVKSLLKCMCVSKRWASIIRGKQFRDLYLLRSMTRPQMLLVVYPMLLDTYPHALFHSINHEEKQLFLSSQRNKFFSTEPRYEITQTFRGLVLLHANNEAAICNPSTRKYMDIPEFQAREDAVITAFFGYDEATNLLKVLCMTDFKDDEPSEGSKEHRVLTVGSGEESWRPITCKYPHSPVTEGLCKGGVLYYGALYNGDTYGVMKFNVRSEEITGFKLPKEFKIYHLWKLVNYKGKLAVVNDPMQEIREKGVVRIWVVDDNEGCWRGIRLEIPCWRETVGNMLVSFKGTTETGQLVFAPNILVENPLPVFCYDTVTRKLKKFMIEGVLGCPYGYVKIYLDHVDSFLPM